MVFRGAIVGVSPHCFRDPAAACPGENRLMFNILSVAAHTTTTNDCPPRKLKAMGSGRPPAGGAIALSPPVALERLGERAHRCPNLALKGGTSCASPKVLGRL